MVGSNKTIFLVWVSGSGKTSVRTELLQHYPEKFAFVPSVSTRAMRDGESEGNPYQFVTKKEFQQLIADDEMLEYNEYVGNYYGTRLQDLEDVRDEGKNPLKELDIVALTTMRKEKTYEWQFITIFLDLDDVEMTKRILGRQPDIDPDQLQQRLVAAEHERNNAAAVCDYMIDASPSLAEVVDAVVDAIEKWL